MKVIEPGHKFELAGGQTIQFEKKRADGEGRMQLVAEGTTTEELAEVLISRIEYLDLRVPCFENGEIIKALKRVKGWSQIRHEKREQAGVRGTDKRHDGVAG